MQEADEEEEESCWIKERLQAFLHWLQGLQWVQRLCNKRQPTVTCFQTAAHICTFLHLSPLSDAVCYYADRRAATPR